MIRTTVSRGTFGKRSRSLLATMVIAAIAAVQAIPALADGVNQPVLLSTSPANNETKKPADVTTVTATYDRNLNPNTTTFQLRNKNNILVNGTVSPIAPPEAPFNAQRTITFTPTQTGSDPALTQAGSPYTATIHAVPAPGGDPTDSTFKFYIDSTVPAAPGITAPAAGALVKDPVTVVGTAEANSTVKIYEGSPSPSSTPLASGPASGGGSFNIAVSFGSNQNGVNHTITATATDAAGNASVASASVSFTHDNVAPTPAPSITSPAADFSTSNTSVTLSGTTTSDTTTIEVFDGTGTAGTTSATGGTWSKTVSGLSDGTHSFTVKAYDAAGNVSNSSTPRVVTVDTQAPMVPTVQVSPSPGINAATQSSVGVSGNAEAGSTLSISINDTNPATPAVVETPSVVATPTPSVVAYSKGGIDVSGLSDGTLTVSVTSTDGANNSTAGQALVSKDSVAPGIPAVIISPDPVNSNNQTAVTVSGGGEANATAEITLSDGTPPVLSFTMQLSNTGGYSHTFDASSLSDGTLTARVVLTDAAGNQGSEGTDTALKDAALPAAPSITSPGAGTVVDSPTLTVSGGGAEDDALVEVLEGSTVLGSVTTTAPGSWSVEITVSGEGAHTIVARQTDENGNRGPGTSRTFFLNEKGPEVVSTNPADDSKRTSVTSVSATYNETLSTGTMRVYDATNTLIAGPSPTVSGSTVTFTPTEPLSTAGSPYTAKTTGTDQQGGLSEEEHEFSFEIDNEPPAKPTLTTPASDLTTSSTSVTLGGGNSADTATILILDNNSQVATATPTGTSWSATVTGLSNGPHPFRVQARDAAGNLSSLSDTTRTITVDTLAPNPPNITAPAQGAVVKTSPVTISGTAEANSVVKVRQSGSPTPIATATADPSSGAWTTSAAFADGSYSINATATDAANNESAPSTPNRSFTVDTTVPAKPVIVSPAQGAVLNNTSVTVSGTSEIGTALVIVRENGAAIATATPDASGNWSVNRPFANGPHTINAVAKDAANNESPPSDNRSFSVDTVPPAVPTIGSPAQGAQLNTSSVTISGFADAGSVVTVRESGAPIATPTAGPSGTWSVSHTFTDGSHTINATATDAAGNTSASSANRTFTVDTVAPAPPTIASPGPGETVGTPAVIIRGTAEPGAIITVKENGATIASTSADGLGAWTVEHTFADGPHTISVTATDAAGNTSAPATRTFTVDANKPAAPAITTPAEGATVDSPVTISGSAEAGTLVTVRENGAPVGVATAGPAGSWSMSKTMSDGPHTINATAKDAANNESDASADRSFTVDGTAPAAPVITKPEQSAIVTSSSVTIEGTAEAASTVTVREGAASLGTATAGADGAWTLTATMTDGPHTVTATATDAVGNESVPSAARTFTVTPDRTAPAAPVIQSPAEGSTQPASVTISGTAEAGATVKVTEGTETIGTPTAGADGAWSLSHTFANGAHAIRATATDAAGNGSAQTAPRNFTVDGTAPTVSIATEDPKVFGPTDTVTITGTASDNGTVTRVVVEYVNAAGTVAVTQDATLTPAGGAASVSWTATPTGLVPGPYTVRAHAVDAAGNSSANDEIKIVKLSV